MLKLTQMLNVIKARQIEYGLHMSKRGLGRLFSVLAVMIVGAVTLVGFFGVQTVQAADEVAVQGAASVVNTGGSVYFDYHGASVKVNGSTGEFSGYGWSSDLGWVAFDGTELGIATGVVVDSSGAVNGSAKVLSAGLIYFSDYGASVVIDEGVFSGHAWSEDVGWIDMAGVTAPGYGLGSDEDDDAVIGDSSVGSTENVDDKPLAKTGSNVRIVVGVGLVLVAVGAVGLKFNRSQVKY